MAIFLLAVAVVIGWLSVQLANPADKITGPPWAIFLLELALGAGGGIALVSFLFFLLLLLHAASPLVMLLTEAVLLLTAAGLVFLRHPRTANEPCRQATGFWWYWILLGALMVSVLAVTAGSAKLAQVDPNGYWDACMIWNLRAKYLAAPGDAWTRAFSPLVIHSDYPLLTSGFVAHLWKFSDGETSTLAPMLTAAVFAASVLALLVSALAMVRGTGSAALAGLTLMTSSSFCMQSMSQYADVPLSYYYLATLTLVLLSAGSEGSRKAILAAMAGAFASFAAWTKNEGLVFFLLSLAVYAFIFRRHKNARPSTAPVWYYLLGAMPGLLMVGYFKVFLAPPNDLTNQTAAQTMHKFVEFDRYLLIARWLIHIAKSRLGDWWTHPLLLLAILAIALRFRLDVRQRQGVVATGLTLGLVCAAYWGVYLLTPHDLHWHLETSLERLCAQVWPSFLFVTFLVLARPEEALFLPKAKQ